MNINGQTKKKNKKSFLSLLNRKIKNKFKHLLKINMITKNLYLKIEKQIA